VLCSSNYRTGYKWVFNNNNRLHRLLLYNEQQLLLHGEREEKRTPSFFLSLFPRMEINKEFHKMLFLTLCAEGRIEKDSSSE